MWKIFPCYQSNCNQYINDLLSFFEHLKLCNIALLYNCSSNLVIVNNTGQEMAIFMQNVEKSGETQDEFRQHIFG